MDIQWPLVVFSLFAGCGGGLVACTGLLELAGKAAKGRAVSLAVAIFLFIVGGCASVLHLAHPASIMAAATNIFSFSGISIELIVLGVNLVVAVVSLAMLRKGAPRQASKVVAVASIVFGVLMAFVVGNGYVMEAQANWNTILLPLGYLLSGVLCGSCLCLAICAVSGVDDSTSRLEWVVKALCIVQLIAFGAYGLVAGIDREPAIFVGGALAIGSLGTLACAFLARKNANLWWVAFACALVGGLCFRSFMWLVGDGYISSFALAASRAVLGV